MRAKVLWVLMAVILFQCIDGVQLEAMAEKKRKKKRNRKSRKAFGGLKMLGNIAGTFVPGIKDEINAGLAVSD